MSTNPAPITAPPAPPEARFAVKLRHPVTKSWGNEVEVGAVSAQAAAEQVAEQTLLEGPGLRENLRARVWRLPHGTVAEVHFYVGA